MGPCYSSASHRLFSFIYTHTTNNKDRLVITSFDLANLDSLLPDLLSLLVVKEEPSLVIHELLNRSLVNGCFVAFGRGSNDLKVLREGVVRVGSFREVPSDWLKRISTCAPVDRNERATHFTVESFVCGRENEQNGSFGHVNVCRSSFVYGSEYKRCRGKERSRRAIYEEQNGWRDLQAGKCRSM